jgi:hypothetical protein
MKKALAIAATTAGLGLASLPARAQGCVVNGRNASQAEVQLLVSHGAQPGKWLVDGYSISAAADIGHKIQQRLPPAAVASAGMCSTCCCAID